MQILDANTSTATRSHIRHSYNNIERTVAKNKATRHIKQERMCVNFLQKTKWALLANCNVVVDNQFVNVF